MLGGAAAAGTAAPGIYVYDRRHPRACAVAASAAACGANPWPIDGDVTRLWTDELAPRWRRGERVAVSGVTGRPALRCLQIMARGHGLALASCKPLGDGLVAWHLAPTGLRG